MAPLPSPAAVAVIEPSALVAHVVGVEVKLMVGLKGLLLTFAQFEAVQPAASMMVRQNCPTPTLDTSSVEALKPFGPLQEKFRIGVMAPEIVALIAPLFAAGQLVLVTANVRAAFDDGKGTKLV